MRRIKFLFLLLSSGIILSSCGRISRIEIGEVRDFTVKGFEENALVIEVIIPIENPSLYKIKISDFEAKIYLNKGYLGRVNNIEPLVLSGKSSENYTLVFKVRMANFFGTASKVMNLQKGQRINLKIEGTVSARSFFMKKKIEINEERDIVL
jgi:LEA14-like dessication related protein